MTDKPPAHVEAAAAVVAQWVREQEQQQPQPQPQRVDAFERFKSTPRSDVPPKMPDWLDSRSAVTGTPAPNLERAIDRFARQRRDRSDVPAPMPAWDANRKD
jgi:hypothetical protein